MSENLYKEFPKRYVYSVAFKTEVVLAYNKFKRENVQRVLQTNNWVKFCDFTASVVAPSMQEFLEYYHKESDYKIVIEVQTLAKWMTQYSLGQFHLSNPSDLRCKVSPQLALAELNKRLTLKFPEESARVAIGFSSIGAKQSMYGLFAKKDMTCNEFVGFYTGVLILESECDAFNCSAQYVHSVSAKLNGKKQAVDAEAFDSCYARYINCSMSLNPALSNVIFSQSRKKPLDGYRSGKDSLEVRATKSISAGTELIAFYGADYWGREIMLRARRDPVRKTLLMCLQKMEDLYPDSSDVESSGENESDDDWTPVCVKGKKSKVDK